MMGQITAITDYCDNKLDDQLFYLHADVFAIGLHHREKRGSNAWGGKLP